MIWPFEAFWRLRIGTINALLLLLKRNFSQKWLLIFDDCRYTVKLARAKLPAKAAGKLIRR